eukprot:1158750-Pelagomonas_calceolata.AAC.4
MQVCEGSVTAADLTAEDMEAELVQLQACGGGGTAGGPAAAQMPMNDPSGQGGGRVGSAGHSSPSPSGAALEQQQQQEDVDMDCPHREQQQEKGANPPRSNLVGAFRSFLPAKRPPSPLIAAGKKAVKTGKCLATSLKESWVRIGPGRSLGAPSVLY